MIIETGTLMSIYTEFIGFCFGTVVILTASAVSITLPTWPCTRRVYIEKTQERQVTAYTVSLVITEYYLSVGD